MAEASATEPVLRVLYTGCPLAGCTSSLKWLFPRLDPPSPYDIESLRDGAPSPVRALVWSGRKTAVQVRHDFRGSPELVGFLQETQRFLRVVDRIVVVVDSQLERMEANLQSLEALTEDLTGAGRNLHEIPVVFQLNKRDLPNVMPSEELVQKLKTRRCSYVETIASMGARVVDAFAAACD